MLRGPVPRNVRSLLRVAAAVLTGRPPACRLAACLRRSHYFRKSLVIAAWKAVIALGTPESYPYIVHIGIMNLAMCIAKGQSLELGKVLLTFRQRCCCCSLCGSCDGLCSRVYARAPQDGWVPKVEHDPDDPIYVPEEEDDEQLVVHEEIVLLSLSLIARNKTLAGCSNVQVRRGTPRRSDACVRPAP